MSTSFTAFPGVITHRVGPPTNAFSPNNALPASPQDPIAIETSGFFNRL